MRYNKNIIYICCHFDDLDTQNDTKKKKNFKSVYAIKKERSTAPPP